MPLELLIERAERKVFVGHQIYRGEHTRIRPDVIEPGNIGIGLCKANIVIGFQGNAHQLVSGGHRYLSQNLLRCHQQPPGDKEIFHIAQK